MADCQPHIAIHQTPGTRQTERLFASLDPAYFLVDDRELADFICFASSLSKEVLYYSDNNLVTGDWTSFFNWEATAVLAHIIKLPILEKIKALEVLRRKLLFITEASDRQEEVITFFGALHLVVQQLEVSVGRLPDELQITEYFKTTLPQIQQGIDGIVDEVGAPGADVQFLLQHHLFNKRIQKLFSLLTGWQVQSMLQLEANISTYAAHSPQYGLYLAFLKLFGIAQEELNGFTKRHLDFYYKEVLRLSPVKAQPDTIHLTAVLHKNKPPFTIKKDTLFLADKNEAGKQKYYQTTSDITINHTIISKLYGDYVSEGNYNFADFLEQNDSGTSWTPFQQTALHPEIGLAIATPLLYLQGGARTIKLKFYKTSAGGVNNVVDFDISNVQFHVSGASEWIPLTAQIQDGYVVLSLTVDDDPVIPFDAAVHLGVALHTAYPVLKITSRYGALLPVKFHKISLNVSVEGVTHYSLTSNTGTVDPSKAYQPFGPIPREGNKLLFGCHEFFQKKGAQGRLNLETDNSDWQIFSNTALRILTDGQWTTVSGLSGGNNLKVTDAIPPGIGSDQYTPQATAGFARLELTDNSYAREKFLVDFIEGAKAAPTSVTLPYIPTINNTTFSYEVSQTIGVGTAANPSNDFQLFYVHPAGFVPTPSTQLFLTPQIPYEGSLMIGLHPAVSGDGVSLLFQMDAGTANPLRASVTPILQYLKGNSWKTLSSSDYTDETNGFTSSGLLRFTVPMEIDLDNQTLLPKAIFWLRIVLPERADAICRFLSIQPQAFKATLIDNQNEGVFFEKVTPAQTISKSLQPLLPIKKITQPYDSFGGRPQGTNDTFYKRSSERLRHKGRAIASWDYERLILDEFPEVHRVKCLHHYRIDAVEVANTAAGYVTIVPVAKASREDIPVSWKPLVPLDTMKRIAEYVEQRTSAHVRLKVVPPQLEYIKVATKITYHLPPGADLAAIEKRVQEALNAYLSPWAFSETETIQFQNAIEPSAIIQLLERLPDVDYLSNFKVYRAPFKETIQPSDFTEITKTITPLVPYALFVPITHDLFHTENTCCS